MEYNVNINGIDVAASYSQESIDNIFKPLLERLCRIRQEKGRRILVMLAAPPGAGKSTLVSFLASYAQSHDLNCDDGEKNIKDLALKENSSKSYKFQAIGMDGFHRRQEYLQTHTMIVDGREVKMVEVKGCPETFDLDKLRQRIEMLLNGNCENAGRNNNTESIVKNENAGNIDMSTDAVVTWPAYDRHLHNPVEGAITVDGDIILLEGNYLLLDEPGWNELSAMADYTISIKADADMLRNRLVDRKEKSGNTREKSEQFVDYSDMRNVRLCLEHTKAADLELCLEADSSYTAE